MAKSQDLRLPYINKVCLVGDLLDASTDGEKDYNCVMHNAEDAQIFLAHMHGRSRVQFCLGIPNVHADGSAWKFGFIRVIFHGGQKDCLHLRDQIKQAQPGTQLYVEGKLHFSPAQSRTDRETRSGRGMPPYAFKIEATKIEFVDDNLEITNE